MDCRLENFIVANSPNGGFLQSEYWRNFQESYGRKTHEVSVSDDGGELVAYANIITHTLPIVGDYFYIPRGPIIENFKFQISNLKSNPNDKIQKFLNDLISLSNENNIGWIRVEPNSEEDLKLVKENLPSGIKMKKSAVDMQPREILVMDISGGEEEILAGMKQKTRYNIRLAEKRRVRVPHNMPARFESRSESGGEHITHNINEFLRLIKITAKRDKITAHPDSYYQKMFGTIPPGILRLYVAEYEGKITCANLVSFFGKTVTYMHGASDYAYREVMAPYLLQWQAILDAKKSGLTQYDFGGVDTRCEIRDTKYKKWEGITKFKTGFAPDVEPMRFPGCYDIVLNPAKYWLYKLLRKLKP